MEEAFPVWGEGESGLVGEDAEGELDGHCVACRDVDREASNKEDEGVGKRVEVEVYPSGPSLGACQGNRVLAEDGRCEHFLHVSIYRDGVVVQTPAVG